MQIDPELWWFDGGDDQQAEDLARLSMAAHLARIQGVCHFSVAAAKLLEIAQQAEPSIDKMMAILEDDSGLASRILRIVNAPAYGLRFRCTSVRLAVTLLGPRELANVAAAAAVVELFPADSEGAARVLSHCKETALVARHLATGCGLGAEEMFTIGLLHDIGKLMIRQVVDAERTQALYAQVGPGCDAEAERAAFGYDHGVLAAQVFKAWRLPAPIPEVVGMHHRPARAYARGGRTAALVCLLRLSDWLAYRLKEVEKPSDELLEEYEAAQVQDYLGLMPAQVRALWRPLRALLRNVADDDAAKDDATLPEDTEEEDAAPSTPEPADARVNTLLCYCGEGTWGETCPCCQKPLCANHVPERGRWCSDCETRYESRVRAKAPLREAALVVLGIAISIEVFMWAWLAQRGNHAHPVLVMTGVGLAIGLSGIGTAIYAHARRWAIRAAMLAEGGPGDASRSQPLV